MNIDMLLSNNYQHAEDILSLEGHTPGLKEVLRSILINVPGEILLIIMTTVILGYTIWSSIKTGVYIGKGLSLKISYYKGFFKSAFPGFPVSISRTIFACLLLLALILCAIRGIIGFIYVSL